MCAPVPFKADDTNSHGFLGPQRRNEYSNRSAGFIPGDKLRRDAASCTDLPLMAKTTITITRCIQCVARMSNIPIICTNTCSHWPLTWCTTKYPAPQQKRMRNKDTAARPGRIVEYDLRADDDTSMLQASLQDGSQILYSSHPPALFCYACAPENMRGTGITGWKPGTS